jgi:hypothetical protein
MDAGRCPAVLPPRETLAADGEVVWSWRRDRGVDPPRLCGNGNGDNKRRSPGRARISRNTIARGKPGCPGCTCGLTRVLFCSTLRTRDCGRSRRPAFPAPSFLRGTTKLQNSGRIGAAGRARVHQIAWEGAGEWWTHKGSNLGPLPCEGNALPLSYASGICRQNQGSEPPDPLEADVVRGLRFTKCGGVVSSQTADGLS